MKEAYLFIPLKNGGVQCRACNHYCRINPGERGICGVRENREGILVSLVYDRIVAAAVDPIEKKPIFHLCPGSTSFSIATVGCNLTCSFCQNSDIAQWPMTGPPVGAELFPGRWAGPDEIVTQALDQGCRSISFTYTEPSVYIELALDTAQLAKEKGLYTIFVTNGFMSPELIERAVPVLDAANVDLKAWSESFYKTFCSAALGPVKKNLIRLKKSGVMVEVTTLIIPGLNDDPRQLSEMAGFIAGELGPETPWHISRFHPAHELTDRGATPSATLEKACDAGLAAGLYHVYTGNLPGGREDTFCNTCGRVLVNRQGYTVQNKINKAGTCPDCHTPVYGIYEP